MTPIRTSIAAALVGLSLLSAGCGDSADDLLAKAKQSIAKKDLKAAEIHLKNLLQKEDHPEARYLLGEAYLSSGDFRSAEKEYQRAMDGGFDKTRAGLGAVNAYVNMGDMAKALALAANLAPSDPADQARLQTMVGRAYMVTGKREPAEKAYKAALAASPGYTAARLGLAALTASRDVAAGQAEVDAVLAKNPDDIDALVLRGDIDASQGRQKEAIEHYTKVAKLDPQNRTVRAKLGSLASDLKDYAGAQKWLDELKKLTGPAPGTMYLQALNDFRQGKLEPARDAILASLKGAPEYLPSVALASTIFLSLNSLEQAEKHARTVVEKAPNSPLGPRLLGTTYLRMNAPDRALQAVQPMLDRGAKDPQLLGIAGEASLKLNEADKAAAFFRRAAELAPNDPTQKTGLGVAKIASGDKAAGIADLEKAAELNPAGGQADLALITQHMRDKSWDKALVAIDRLDKKQPKNPLVHNLRGTVRIGQGDMAAARQEFEAAIALDPKFFASASNLAALDLRDKKVDDAKKRYLKLLESDPKNIRAMLTLAEVVQGTGGDKAQVLEWIKKAHETDKTSVAATLALTRFHMTYATPKEALPALQEALTSAPENIELLDALGTAYLTSGDESQAIATFEKVLRLKPDSAPLQLRMGEFYLGRKDPERAMQYFRKAAELAPTDVAPKAAIASALVVTGKVQEARAIATNLQKEAPRSAAGAVLEGDILAYDKKFAEAAGSYRRALATQRSAQVHVKLHRALVAAGKSAEADAELKAVLKDNPNDAGLKNYAAMSEISRKRWPEAIARYKEIVALQPSNAVALNNLAWAQHEMKDPEALNTAEKALALAPRAHEVLDTYGVILMAAGKADKAVDTLKQAVSIAPRNPGYRLHLAEALMVKGDKAAARKEIDSAMPDIKGDDDRERARALAAKL